MAIQQGANPRRSALSKARGGKWPLLLSPNPNSLRTRNGAEINGRDMDCALLTFTLDFLLSEIGSQPTIALVASQLDIQILPKLHPRPPPLADCCFPLSRELSGANASK